MSDEYNVKLLVKEANLNAISINSANVNSHNKKYSGFKDLLKDNIPESLADYNGNAYDISSVFHDTNWSDNTKTPSTNSSQSNQKFSQIETNANLELYKNAKLVPHEDASGTTHKLWTVYDDASNNLLEHMINYKFDNSGSYLPILTYHNGSLYVESTMFSDPLWWLIDYENHAISFFNTDSVLNGGTVNISTSSTNPPKLTFYRYIGKTKVNNKLSVEGDISCNEVIVSGTTLTSKLGVIDLSYSDLSGVVTANIASIVANESNIASNASGITELDISYVDLSGVVTANIASIAANESNISTLNNDKAPKADPTFTGKLNIDNTEGGFLIESHTNYNRIKSEQGNNSTAGKDLLITSGGTVNNSTNWHQPDIYIKTDGNVGIGTNDPKNALHLYNTENSIVMAQTDSGGQLSGFVCGGGTASYYGFIQDDGGNKLDIVYASDKSYFESNSYTSIDGTNLKSFMTFDSNGNVGIGTSSPGAKLDVANTMPKIYLTNNRNSDNGNFSNNEILGTIALYSKDQNASSDVGETASINFVNTYINSATSPYPGISFNVHRNINTDSVIEAMRIEHTGKVGIGTTSPAAPLSVCRIQNDFNTTRDMGVHMGVYNSGGAHFPNIQFVSNHEDGSWIDFVHTTTGNSDFDGRIRYSHTNGFQIYTNHTQQMTIDTNGNVGIGASSPKFPLHVESGDNTYKFGSPGTETYTYFSYNHVGIPSGTHSTDAEWDYDTSIYAKYGIVTNTYIVSHRGAIVSSDERIKCEIENVPDDLALNQVLALETKYYHYKDPKRRETEKTIGFIAQEVESIIPGTVVKRQQFIPNILKTGDAIWTPKKTDTSGNTIMWNLQVANLQDISANTEVKFYFYNGDISNNTDIIEYEKDLTAIDASNNFEIDTKYDHVFVFGVKVNDFRTIKKEKIFALHHSAIQQIHKNAEAEKTKLAEAETEITTLKSTVETQQTTIDNQQNTINTLQSTLAALEARIAALENP